MILHPLILVCYAEREFTDKTLCMMVVVGVEGQCN